MCSKSLLLIGSLCRASVDIGGDVDSIAVLGWDCSFHVQAQVFQVILEFIWIQLNSSVFDFSRHCALELLEVQMDFDLEKLVDCSGLSLSWLVMACHSAEQRGWGRGSSLRKWRALSICTPGEKDFRSGHCYECWTVRSLEGFVMFCSGYWSFVASGQNLNPTK